MIFRIIKIAAWSAAGWALYQALKAVPESVDEAQETGSPRADVEATPEPEVEVVVATGRATVPAGDDLRKVRGIGPSIKGVLNDRGITTWSELAATDVADLRMILEQAGPRYRVHDPSTWPAQAAELAQAN